VTSHYQHQQIGWVMLAMLGLPLFGLVAFIMVLLARGQVQTAFIIVLIALPFAISLVLFSSLTVEISDTALTWYFGPRFWKNTLPLSQIKTAAQVHTKWYWGYGIKYFGPNRRLYNVSGTGAVEIRANGAGWIRIGTDDPVGLLEALRRRGTPPEPSQN
jgi:hypothetical protein